MNHETKEISPEKQPSNWIIEADKKIFFNGSAVKALHSSPSSLMAVGTFLLEKKSLMARPLDI